MGLVPPSVPALTFTAATVPALLKFRIALLPVILIVVPVRLQLGASDAVPEAMLRVVPASNGPLAASVAAPPRLKVPAPVTNELPLNVWFPPPKLRTAPAEMLKLAVCAPPKLRFNVLACTCRSPVL